MSRDLQAKLRALPSVDRLLTSIDSKVWDTVARDRVVALLRDVLDACRHELRSGVLDEAPGTEELLRLFMDRLRAMNASCLRPVINATGVVLHTNLGRAALSQAAREAVNRVTASYNNLEYDLTRGERGSRYASVTRSLCHVTGAEDALVVNNNAAAVLLCLQVLAHGREVIVSRGELVEIGGSFRIPDVMRTSGAHLVEVGTTNRTHERDYLEAIGDCTGLLMKVHTSNYRMVGFTASVLPEELAILAHRFQIPLIYDMGSGVLTDLSPAGVRETRTVGDMVAAGVDLVTFSGDKLLGGPQAGIIVGKACYVERLRRDPLLRALRVDKMVLAALEATLNSYARGMHWQEIPILRALSEPLASVEQRAHCFVRGLGDAHPAEIRPGFSAVGGGALPDHQVATALIFIPSSGAAHRWAKDLRAEDPPVVVRVEDDALVLDLRTVAPTEESPLLEALRRVIGGEHQ